MIDCRDQPQEKLRWPDSPPCSRPARSSACPRSRRPAPRSQGRTAKIINISWILRGTRPVRADSDSAMLARAAIEMSVYANGRFGASGTGITVAVRSIVCIAKRNIGNTVDPPTRCRTAPVKAVPQRHSCCMPRTHSRSGRYLEDRALRLDMIRPATLGMHELSQSLNCVVFASLSVGL
ncbi:hypothetical protein REMIM1_CH02034 [Rhizobium etli bv. mimosae str. Mim1]|nr:hypothetical protein REMIM1_CH02034 [Rhizobium etli bv. mimosae str. Mim1]